MTPGEADSYHNLEVCFPVFYSVTGEYDAILCSMCRVQFVKSKPPILTIYDADNGETIESVNLSKFTTIEIHELLASRGFRRGEVPESATAPPGSETVDRSGEHMSIPVQGAKEDQTEVTPVKAGETPGLVPLGTEQLLQNHAREAMEGRRAFAVSRLQARDEEARDEL